MNEMNYYYRDIITEINSIYAKLRFQTADNLRNRVDEIKERIKRSEDKSNLLNTLLPEVYAIIKETARRFSQGEIVVKANPNDKRLSHEFDFVIICDDKAIYKNH